MKKNTVMKKFAAAGCIAAMVLTTAACGSGSQGSSSGSSSTASAGETAAASSASGNQDLKELDVVLDWYPNAIHTFLYEAQEKGYFADEGLKVKLIPPAESVDAINFVASGKAQIGLSYPIDTITAVANEDMPVRAIGAVSQKELNCLCTLKKNDPNKDLASLKGKKIGYSGTGSAQARIATMMKTIGLTDQDYELVNVGFDLVTALTTGNCDAVSGTLINDEVITMEQSGYDVNVYQYEDYGCPGMYGIVMVANNDEYQKDPETYNAFLRACSKGFDDMKSSEEESLDIIMNKMSTEDNPLDETQQKGSYETLIPLMETDDAPFLSMTEETWQDTIDWMKEADLIKKDVTPDDVMTAPSV